MPVHTVCGGELIEIINRRTVWTDGIGQSPAETGEIVEVAIILCTICDRRVRLVDDLQSIFRSQFFLTELPVCIPTRRPITS